MFYCSNRASICSHALFLLSQTRWFVTTGWLSYKHQSTARVQTRLDCGSLLYTCISFHPVFQTCLDYGSLSAHTHQVPALCFKHVWNVYPCLRTRVSFQHCVSKTSGTSICLLLPWSNTFGFGSLLCTRIRFHPCLKHVQIKFPCLRTCISPSPVFRMCLDCGSLSGHTHPSPALFKHV